MVMHSLISKAAWMLAGVLAQTGKTLEAVR